MVTGTDAYTTIAREARAKTKIRGSLFIATAVPVATREDAERVINRIRSEFGDATHNCFAYRIGPDGGETRMADDGEPRGTAGRPIRESIEKHSVTNVVVVVTRYYGGTKLGVGGLKRAYSEAASDALQTAQKAEMFVTEQLVASFPHSYISSVMHAITKVSARVSDAVYDEEVHRTIEIRKSKAQELESLLMDQTSGNVRLRRLG